MISARLGLQTGCAQARGKNVPSLATRSKCRACKVAGLQQLFRDWMKDVGAKELSPNSACDPVDLLFQTRD